MVVHTDCGVSVGTTIHAYLLRWAAVRVCEQRAPVIIICQPNYSENHRFLSMEIERRHQTPVPNEPAMYLTSGLYLPVFTYGCRQLVYDLLLTTVEKEINVFNNYISIVHHQHAPFVTASGSGFYCDQDDTIYRITPL